VPTGAQARSQGRRRALPHRCRTPLHRAEVVTRLRKGGERSGGWIAVRELLYFWEDAVSTGRARSPCRITRKIPTERDGEMVEERGRTDDVVPLAVRESVSTRARLQGRPGRPTGQCPHEKWARRGNPLMGRISAVWAQVSFPLFLLNFYFLFSFIINYFESRFRIQT
jgi:hypothetical protein